MVDTRDDAAGAGASRSAPRLPSIASPTLPKGGGAIRGLGEKLTPTAAKGTAALSIPVYTSPSRGDTHPKLSLDYDSGAGNGPFGLGWRLSLPQITRRTDRGLPRYRDADESDTFILSGADFLVPIDSRAVGSEQVIRYRPRVETGFSRIERHTDPVAQSTYWVVVSRDNVTTTFGRTAESRVFEPGSPQRVFAWLPDRISDDRGNVVELHYKRENADGAPSAVFEQNRPGADEANVHLKTILYGNRTPGGADFSFQVVLDYGEHGEVDPSQETSEALWPTPVEKRPWTHRADAFSSYRAGFEVRTRRLCRRVLMFHRFRELGSDDQYTLVRSTDLGYEQTPAFSYLRTATQTGYRHATATESAAVDTYPELRLDYTRAAPGPVRRGGRVTTWGLPAGIDPATIAWVDLDGEGLAGALTAQGGAWIYKRNGGAGVLEAPTALARQPLAARATPAAPLLVDLDGSGRKALTQFAQPDAGYFARTTEGWDSFEPFVTVPNVDLADPNLRHVDVDGDGISDLLLSCDDAFVWYPSLGRSGFGAAERLARPSDEESGPAIVFADADQSIFLADMTGDGLEDIVRIRNGEVCYWPNLGYGRFGARVAMSGAPAFDSQEGFDPTRVRLADVDGSGTTDLVYLGRDDTRFWINQAGNAWSEASDVGVSFPTTQAMTASVVDFLGTGTSCLVWSSPVPGDDEPLRYLDLLGGVKPHLLKSIDNGLGRVTTITYAPSTQYYLVDRRAGHPWATRLPFVLHVVSSIEHRDEIARTRVVSTYEYHHGDWDGREREFRGFGRVDQRDAEDFGVSDDGSTSKLKRPPVLIKTWFHTGDYHERNRVLRHFEGEFYSGDPGAPQAAGTLLPTGFTFDETRDAARALRSQPLREETYAEDGSGAAADVPYRVRTWSYEMKCLERGAGRAHSVWFGHEADALEIDYDRVADDPRATRTVTLTVDDYGNLLESVRVALPRRTAGVPGQQDLLAIYTSHAVVNRDDDFAYRVGVPCETETFELVGLPDPLRATLRSQIDNAPRIDVDAAAAGAALRRIAHQYTLYYADNLTDPPLAKGDAGLRALAHTTYELVLTKGLVQSAYGTRIAAVDLTATLQTEAGLQGPDADGGWWAPSGRDVPDAASFYMPIAHVDAFGNRTNVTYDAPYLLHLASVADALGNVSSATYDYRVLAANLVTEVNGNQSAAAYDPLGRQIARAEMGKGEGDSLSAPTVAYEYDAKRWRASGKPAMSHESARMEHKGNRFQETYVHADGGGREAMRKVLVEDGPVPQVDANGHLVRDAQGNVVTTNASPRWVGTGRTVFDNKENPVEKYEPYFSASWDFEDEAALVEQGVTPVLGYDPLGRVIRTDYPDGTLSRTDFGPWQKDEWDQNDTVLESTWYATRIALTGATPDDAAQKRAATLTAQHAKTPTTTVLDSSGRVVQILTRLDPTSAPLVTTITRDAPGRAVRVQDPRGIVTGQTFDLRGVVIATDSPDAGMIVTLFDATGGAVRSWNGRGDEIRASFDALRRRTDTRVVAAGTSSLVLMERILYGESLDAATAKSSNALGRRARCFDGAGASVYASYDLDGNPTRTERRLWGNPTVATTWAVLEGKVTVADCDTAANPLLDGTSYVTQNAYDAFGRVLVSTTPDSSVSSTTYGLSGRVVAVTAAVHGTGTPANIVSQVSYDPKGRRASEDLGDGISTAYTYDPATFRLVRVKTTRASDGAILRDLHYAFDPVGNVAEIRDDGTQLPVDTTTSQYVYDALYRLVDAIGVEHPALGSMPPPDAAEGQLFALPHPNDLQKLRDYHETYGYDASGNLTSINHVVLGAPPVSGWSRALPVGATSNQLQSTTVTGSAQAAITYDGDGNVGALPNVGTLGWDYANRLTSANLLGGGMAYYGYDDRGARIRKVVQRSAGFVEERIYLGALEIFRRTVGGKLDTVRETLHVGDGSGRAALIETLTLSGGSTVSQTNQRFQIADHVGSSMFETDESGALISVEVYYPYGGTSFLGSTGIAQTNTKRYRYAGKERDEESGLYAFGARYYAPWLCRWTGCDPARDRDTHEVPRGSLYVFARGNPLRFRDDDGRIDTDISVAGTYAHILIQAYYQSRNPGHNVIGNYVDFARIASNIALGDVDASRVYAAELLLRPDIIDYSKSPKGGPALIYEIKPESKLNQAYKEAQLYQYVHSLLFPNAPVILGPAGAPGTEGEIPVPGGKLVFRSPIEGTIVYEYVKDQGKTKPGKRWVPDLDKLKNLLPFLLFPFLSELGKQGPPQTPVPQPTQPPPRPSPPVQTPSPEPSFYQRHRTGIWIGVIAAIVVTGGAALAFGGAGAAAGGFAFAL